MAISKQKKEELVEQYFDWINNSSILILTEYKGLAVKDLDDLRKKTRGINAEFHIVKNTLSEIAFQKTTLKVPENTFIDTTAIAFASEDAPRLAKIITDLSKEHELVKLKCGYLNDQLLSVDEIIALAELPPLPVLRAQLMGTIMASSNKLVRTLAEPARQLTAVIKAYADAEPAQA